jgi:hypothetical protein
LSAPESERRYELNNHEQPGLEEFAMTNAVEQSLAPSSGSHRGDFEPDLVAAEDADEGDMIYAEITERRAQLENPEILRGARAL